VKVQYRWETCETGKSGFLNETTAFCNFYVSCVLEIYENLLLKSETSNWIVTAVYEACLDAIFFILVTYIDL